MIFQRGGDVKCANILGFTTLLAAVETEDAEMVNILLSYCEFTYLHVY